MDTLVGNREPADDEDAADWSMNRLRQTEQRAASDTRKKESGAAQRQRKQSKAVELEQGAPELLITGGVWKDLEFFRKSLGESQMRFWSRFGTTQSAGSRYEDDNSTAPQAVMMLVIAFAAGIVQDAELRRLASVTSSRTRKASDGQSERKENQS